MKILVIVLVLLITAGGLAMIFKEQLLRVFKGNGRFREILKSKEQVDEREKAIYSDELKIYLDEIEFGKKVPSKNAEKQQTEKDTDTTIHEENINRYVEREEEGNIIDIDFRDNEEDVKGGHIVNIDFKDNEEAEPVLKYYVTDKDQTKMHSGIITENDFPFIVGRDSRKVNFVIKDEPDDNGNYIIADQYLTIDRVNGLFKVERVRKSGSNGNLNMMVRKNDGKIMKMSDPYMFDEKAVVIISRPDNARDINVEEFHIEVFNYEDEIEVVQEKESESLKTQEMPEKQSLIGEVWGEREY